MQSGCPSLSTAADAPLVDACHSGGRCSLGPLVVPNEGSTARDHLARDRTWIQWVRLSAVLIVVAAALILRFKVGQNESNTSHPSDWSSKFAKQFGYCFAIFATIVPIVGTIEYFDTHKSMANKMGIIQTGLLSRITVTLIALLTSTTCLILFFTDES